MFINYHSKGEQLTELQIARHPTPTLTPLSRNTRAAIGYSKTFYIESITDMTKKATKYELNRNSNILHLLKVSYNQIIVAHYKGKWETKLTFQWKRRPTSQERSS